MRKVMIMLFMLAGVVVSAAPADGAFVQGLGPALPNAVVSLFFGLCGFALLRRSRGAF